MRIPATQSLALCATMLLGLTAFGATPTEPMTRPDLNGTRVRAPGTATVYLIDNGFRRAVPHVPAYEALFRDWECIVEDLDIEAIRLGDPLGESVGLLKSGEASGVYFIDGTTRRSVAPSSHRSVSPFGQRAISSHGTSRIRSQAKRYLSMTWGLATNRRVVPSMKYTPEVSPDFIRHGLSPSGSPNRMSSTSRSSTTHYQSRKRAS